MSALLVLMYVLAFALSISMATAGSFIWRRYRHACALTFVELFLGLAAITFSTLCFELVKLNWPQLSQGLVLDFGFQIENQALLGAILKIVSSLTIGLGIYLVITRNIMNAFHFASLKPSVFFTVIGTALAIVSGLGATASNLGFFEEALRITSLVGVGSSLLISLYLFVRFPSPLLRQVPKKLRMVGGISSAVLLPMAGLDFAGLEAFQNLASFAIGCYLMISAFVFGLATINLFDQPAYLDNGRPSAHFQTKYKLSKRELEILNEVLEGHSNLGIGERLFISAKTVENHLYKIFQKTGVKNRIELYRLVTILPNQQTPKPEIEVPRV